MARQATGVGAGRHVAGARTALTALPVAPRITARDWLYFTLQICLVASIELADDGVHALLGQSAPQVSIVHALRLVNFERLHDLWIEPAIQGFFERTHHLLGVTISWAQVVPVADLIYGPAYVLCTFAFALWVYLQRRGLFILLRNVFICTSVCANIVQEAFPTTPPRLTPDLSFDGRPYHFTDAVFGAVSGLQVGFNQFAAMPSVHVGWSLIVGLAVFWLARPRLLRLLGLLWPATMVLTVIVTGNHYITDALGAVAVFCASVLVALAIEWKRSGDHSPRQLLHRLNASRHAVA